MSTENNGSVKSIFEYQAETLNEYTFEQKGNEVKEEILKLLISSDYLPDEDSPDTVFYGDPDETFVIIRTDSFVQVMLCEGEAAGDIVFHAEENKAPREEWQLPKWDITHFEPGPWQQRVRMLMGD